MGTGKFWLVSLIVAAALLALTRWQIQNEYFFFAGYVVLQYVVLATAWNILGGYTGYTNFGTGAFFAVRAYTSVVLHKLTSVPVPVMILAAGMVSGVIGFGMGYLTLRLKGVFFAVIATLAMAIVAQTLIVNWGLCRRRARHLHHPAATGAAVRRAKHPVSLFADAAVELGGGGDRPDDRAFASWGSGFNAIRDDEEAAEAAGVPTLRLKADRHHPERRLDGHVGARPCPIT